MHFDNQKGRGKTAPREILANYIEYLQCDGYQVYDGIGKENKEIILIGFLIHACRYFHDAHKSDAVRSQYALLKFQEIYRIDKEIKDEEEDPARRLERRIDEIKPLMLEIKEWIANESHKILPKSPIGKAMTYCQRIFQTPDHSAKLADVQGSR